MNQEEVIALFDKQAVNYDSQWSKTAPIRNCLYLLLDSMFAELPSNANILCVGAGTGAELLYLAEKHPGWTFTALEPSGAMLNECKRLTEEQGFSARCTLFEGYIDALPNERNFDAATCFLVSQFILDKNARIDLFKNISRRLKDGGLLASSDLASDIKSSEYETLLRGWLNMIAKAEVTGWDIDQMREMYAKDIGVIPAGQVATIIEAGGFETPVQFFQSGLICAWISKIKTGSK